MLNSALILPSTRTVFLHEESLKSVQRHDPVTMDSRTSLARHILRIKFGLHAVKTVVDINVQSRHLST